MKTLNEKNTKNSNKTSNPTVRAIRVSGMAGSTMTKFERSRHADEQKLAALIPESKDEQLVALDINSTGGLLLLREVLRRLYKRGTLQGFRLDEFTMHYIKRDCRTFRGERTTPEYWVDRALRVLEANGCITLRGDTVNITQKGKAWLFEATVKTTEHCSMGRHGYEYLRKLGKEWMMEMDKRKTRLVSAHVLNWATG